MMNRRRFLIASGGASAMFVAGATTVAQDAARPLPFVITLQASGAWDPTFLVDPIVDNAAYSPFSAAHVMTAGQIRYLPFDVETAVTLYTGVDGVQDFFQKHFQRMVVWNGVDNATVSHDVGPRIAFTGSTRDGQPTLSGLVAGLQGQQMPLAMFVSGGYASTGGLVPITRGGSLSLLQGLADPNRDSIHLEQLNTLLRGATRERDARLLEQMTLPRMKNAMAQVIEARSGALEDRFVEISEVLQRASAGVRNPIAEVAAGVLALMSSGATAAAHLSLNGFDTHTGHDDLNNGQRPALADLLTGIDYIVDTAAADPVISERGLVVLVGSDFGRTTYNDGGGKDHWPITSMMALGVGASEAVIGGGQVIGATQVGGQNGVAGMPVKVLDGRVTVTEEDDPEGFALTAGHVQLSLRGALGLLPSAVPDDPLRQFQLNVAPANPLPILS